LASAASLVPAIGRVHAVPAAAPAPVVAATLGFLLALFLFCALVVVGGSSSAAITLDGRQGRSVLALIQFYLPSNEFPAVFVLKGLGVGLVFGFLTPSRHFMLRVLLYRLSVFANFVRYELVENAP
jgi:hypothetical protein